VSAADTQEFPRISGRSLDGERYELPEDLVSRWNLIVAAFRREQQELVDEWLPWLLEQQRSRRDVAVFELPILSSAFSPFRSFIDGGMARGVGTDEARARTITVYTNVSKVVHALGLSGTDTIAVMLVDRSGRILARELGGYDERAADRLRAAISGEP